MLPLHRGLLIVALCVLALVCSPLVVAQEVEDARPQANVDNSKAGNVSELPDSPGTIWAKSQEPAQNSSAQTTNPQSDSSVSNQQPEASKQNDKLQRPVGTAAAEAPKVTGVTGAQPAGVAIAPPKQHRVRTIVIKVGAILGAGAAIGTVVALTAATPSKPPGAH